MDATNFYFIDSGANAVWQVNKSTLARTQLAANQATPLHIAVDDTTVYWSSNLGGAILSAPIGGGSVTVLYPANTPTSIVVDDTYVYWTDGTNRILKAPKQGDAGAPATLVTSTTAVDLRIDDQNLYGWNPAPTMPFGPVVFAIDKTTGAITTYQPTLGAMGSVHGIGISLTDVFWGFANGPSEKILTDVTKSGMNGLSGGSVSTVPWEITADSCAVYWTDNANSVWTMPLSGQLGPRALTSSATQSGQIAVDDSYVYWTDQTWIGRVPK